MKLPRLRKDRRWNAAWMLTLLFPQIAICALGFAALGRPPLAGVGVAVLTGTVYGGWLMAQTLPERAGSALAWMAGGMTVATAVVLAASRG